MAIDVDKKYNYDKVEGETSDVFYVLSCVCNKLNIDIFNCLKEKEKKNISRVWKKAD